MGDTLFGLGVGTEMVIAFFVFLLLRVPVAFALGLAAIFAMWQLGFGLDFVGDLIAASVTRFSLLAIPFFILAGILMGAVGMAKRMLDFFRVAMGALPGGMGVVGTVVCLFWGSVSGSGPASVAAIGPLIVKGMTDDGYRPAFAAALVCTGAALSIVIPPSIGLVIYGVIAETSISGLFLAAIVPGLLMGLLMLLALPFAKRGGTAGERSSLQELLPEPYAGEAYATRLVRSFLDAFWGLLTPILILGGIYSGAFTPTEAAIIATVYALFVGAVIYRTLTPAVLFKSLSEASAGSAAVMLVVAFASLFGWVVTVDDLVGQYSGALLALSENPWVILAVMLAILLVTGMFMDAITIMFITLPIFLPVVRAMGWDPTWFGVVLMVSLAIGLFTPPVGINLFVAANITRLSIERIAVAAVPFLLVSLLGLSLLAAFPVLSQLGGWFR
ncbi:MAG: TRAP transporter large permease [Geminicoccaceae bacterium]|nr:MAG: TRAP transporter large permease [Geminicoccaceae bacterium]